MTKHRARGSKRGRHATKKPKTSKAALLRDWGLPASFQWRSLRYKHPYEKGVSWYWTSVLVRLRDVQTYGTCISCNKPITFETCQAGHFAPADDCGPSLNFDLRNLNAECYYCNGFNSFHLVGYARHLNERYGQGTAETLEARYQAHRLARKNGATVKDHSPAYYQALATERRSLALSLQSAQPGAQRPHTHTPSQ